MAEESEQKSYLYRGEHNPWVKGSVCLVLEFAPPPFSPPLPCVVEAVWWKFQNKTGTGPLTQGFCSPLYRG